MSGAAIIEGIALIGVVITTIPVISDLFNPKPDSSSTTKVRLIAGDGDGTEGNVPHVTLWDRQGNNIGWTDWEKTDFKDDILHKGQPVDLSIEQISKDSSANGAEYLGMFASGDNMVCISIITVTTPTGVLYSWMGDIAKQCGAPWFPGNVVASSGPKGEVRPACVWLDMDETNGLKTKGIGFHLPSFQSNPAREADYGNFPDKMCKSDPRFKVYEGDGFALQAMPYFKEPVYDPATLLDYGDKALDTSNWDKKPDIDLQDVIFPQKNKRNVTARADGEVTKALPPQQKKRPGHLVVTTFGAHSAKEVCESETSWGPDLVNPDEGYYCDMESKTLWEVCTEGGEQTGCFDMETNRVKTVGTMRRGRRGVNNKKYTEVRRWA